MFCEQCGSEMTDGEIICQRCGCINRPIQEETTGNSLGQEHKSSKRGKYLKRTSKLRKAIKILLWIVIPVLVIIGGLYLYDRIYIYMIHKNYPITAYRYDSADAFYDVFKETDSVMILEENNLKVKVKEYIELEQYADTDEYEDEYRIVGDRFYERDAKGALLVLDIRNNADRVIRVGSGAQEVNGMMKMVDWSVDVPAYEKKEVAIYLSLQPADKNEQYHVMQWSRSQNKGVTRFSFELFVYEVVDEWDRDYSKEKRSHFIRIYPKGRSAYHFEAPLMTIDEVLYDDDGLVLAVAKDKYCYYFYNGAGGCLDAEVSIKELNGVACFPKNQEESISGSAFSYGLINHDVLPGTYIIQGYETKTATSDIEYITGSLPVWADIHYEISCWWEDVSGEKRLYPRGKDAYNQYIYEYKENDLVLYEDDIYKVTMIYANIDSEGDFSVLGFYVENNSRYTVNVQIDDVVLDGMPIPEDCEKTVKTGDTAYLLYGFPYSYALDEPKQMGVKIEITDLNDNLLAYEERFLDFPSVLDIGEK